MQQYGQTPQPGALPPREQAFYQEPEEAINVNIEQIRTYNT